eukprot:TRINITY_DN2716_c0_g2_i1.p1 TRINITY_DN2716_c0_g2~~TRINITY_DN2716_c0_g2_i1.p1  ORF type:complete len:309 (-),score=49.70 TRINITY_DN2716_c0_g2_i1:210-1136(-)
MLVRFVGLLHLRLLCWSARQSGLSFGSRKPPAGAKIACLGDSLTTGFPFHCGRPDDECGYPYHLGDLLRAQDNEVRNFGKEGTTVVSSQKSYSSEWYESSWNDALIYEPDIVLLMFGANDVKEHRLKKFREEFNKRFISLIQSFLALQPKPAVYIMIPPPLYDNDIYGPEFRPPGFAGGMQQKPYHEELPDKLREIAEETGATLIDIRTCFLRHPSCEDVHKNCCKWETTKPPSRKGEEAEDDKGEAAESDKEESAADACSLHDDAIHPNDEGHRNMALMVKRVLVDGASPSSPCAQPAHTKNASKSC